MLQVSAPAQFSTYYKSGTTYLVIRYPNNFSLLSSLRVNNTQTTEEKIGKLNFIKIQNFVLQRILESLEITLRIGENICKLYIW